MPVLNGARREVFIAAMVRSLRETPLHLVLNMDETSWKLVAHQVLTVAQKVPRESPVFSTETRRRV
jgi:hypothetical protein